MHHTLDLYGPMGFQTRYTQEEMSDPADQYTQFITSGAYKNVFDYNGQRSEMYYIPQVSQLPAEVHPTQWIGDRERRFPPGLRRIAPVLSGQLVHPSASALFTPPAPWNKMYRTVSDDPYMPEDPAEFAAFMSDRFTLDKVGISRQDLSLLRNFYFACISFVDYQISRIIDTLKARGLYDNTIIFFSSDHGEMLGDFGTMGKRSMLDGACASRSCSASPVRPQRAQRCLLARGRRAHASALPGSKYCGEHFDGIDPFSDARHSEVYLAVQHRKEGRLHRLCPTTTSWSIMRSRIAGITSTACRRIPTAMMHPTPAYASCAPCWSSTCRRTAAQTAEEARTSSPARTSSLRSEARRPSGAPRRRACKNALGYEIDI